MVHIEPRHLIIIQSILAPYPYTFYVFGSRATGKARPLSDLDICYLDSIPPRTIQKIEAAFEDSDLPYTVDLVDWNACDTTFKKNIAKNRHCLQLGEKGDLLSNLDSSL